MILKPTCHRWRFGLQCHVNATALNGVSESGSRPQFVAIGPEGGFSEDEVQLAVSSGAQVIHLRANILRIETAAVAIAVKLLI